MKSKRVKVKSFLLLLLFLFQGVLMSGVVEKVKINGVDVPLIFEKDTNLPIASFEFVFKASGHLADGELEGLVRLSSKLLNEGTKKIGSVAFAQKLENEAIDVSVHYGKESFVIDVSCLKDKIPSAIKAVNDILTDPNYSKDTIEKIKTIAIGEIVSKGSDYDYIAAKNLNQLIFKNTPLAKSELGTVESIKKITLQDIQNFIKEYLVLNNAIVVAGGDLDIDEVKKLSIDALKSLQKGEGKEAIHYEAIEDKKEKIINIKDIKQAYIYFGSRYNLKYSDEDVYKATVANFILGSSGFGSRLMEEIRVKRGLAYSAYSRVSIAKSHNIFSGFMQTKIESQNEAIKVTKELISEFVKNGVTKEELEQAKKFLLGSEPLRNETLSQRVSRAFDEYYQGFKLGHTKEVLEKIRKLELDDLNSFIKSHPEILNLSFAIVTK